MNQGMPVENPALPLVTIVIVPRERFSVAWESLQSILAHTTDIDYRLIYVDAGSPEPLRSQLRAAADEHGFTLLRVDHFLSPNQSRNRALPHIATRYAAFCDNDILMSPEWLSRLVACAEETGASIVTPLLYEGRPEQQIVHCAGGDFHIEESADAQGGKRRRVVERMHLQKRKLPEVQPAPMRSRTTLAEFHCLLVRSEALRALGPFDEAFLNTKEHLDFCMNMLDSGGSIYFEPSSVVTYVFNRPLTSLDYRFFMLRWSDDWELRSLEHFISKRQLDRDRYFQNRIANRGWRRHLAIWRPMARRLSFGYRNKVFSRVLWALDRYLLNPLIVRQHRRQAGQA